MSGKSYSEKLRDPRWQKKRLEILNRDKFECLNCATTSETLHVHHRYYVKGRDPWDYPNFALISLCKGCHENGYDPAIHGYDLACWEQAVEWLSDTDSARFEVLFTLSVVVSRVQFEGATFEEIANAISTLRPHAKTEDIF